MVPKVLLTTLVWPLISRWLEVEKRSLFPSLPKSFRKRVKKFGVFIEHDSPSQVMEFHHISNEEFGNVTCIIYLVAWNEMSHLSKPIHNHKNRVKSPLSFWNTKDKIHANVFPREGDNEEGSVQAMRHSFSLDL